MLFICTLLCVEFFLLIPKYRDFETMEQGRFQGINKQTNGMLIVFLSVCQPRPFLLLEARSSVRVRKSRCDVRIHTYIHTYIYR